MSQPKCISDHSDKRKSVMALGAVLNFLTLSRITSPNVKLIHCVQLIHCVTVTEVCPIDQNATVVAAIDSIVSNPGALLPWKEMVDICRKESGAGHKLERLKARLLDLSG